MNVKGMKIMDKTIVIALGGNAILQEGEVGTIAEQFANTRRSLIGVLELVRQGYQIVITHGNGPQVGNYLIRVEEGRGIVPTIPLGVMVADIEGGMGYMIEQCLQNILHDARLDKEIVCMITQVLVDKDDPAILSPTKFVGPFYTEEQAQELAQSRKWQMKADANRGWRRVVPSPRPQVIVGKRAIQLMLENDIIVIAAGGGGIPVYTDVNGWLEGVDAVIDKDYASAILARDVNADEFMILTGVEKVCINFGKPNQRALSHITASEARQYLGEGQFPPGSMGPKIEAAIYFLENGGKRVVITSIERSGDAVSGKAGTVITP